MTLIFINSTLSFAALLVLSINPYPAYTQVSITKVIGTWTGQSICVGDRPACKNEEVVYRFVEVSGKTDLLTLYADKILDGKRVPMGKLDFIYDARRGALSGEFTRGQTHGVWRYQISGDQMEGDLMILPDKTIGRKVAVHRTSDEKVPKAPALTEY